MLASKASMMFPALLFEADSYFYSAFLTPEHLHHERRGAMKRLPGQELVDSAGRRFRIDTVVNPERIGPRWTAWLEGKVLREPLYRFDMELTQLPSITFTEVLNLVMEKEAEAEGYHLLEGGGPDSEDDKNRLARCRSISDIIDVCEVWSAGEPPTAR